MSGKISNKMAYEFKEYVSRVVGKNYKTGLLGKQRTRWALVKAWNAPYFRIATPGDVRSLLGETEATRLFQDTADSITNDPIALELALNEARVQDMFNQP